VRQKLQALERQVALLGRFPERAPFEEWAARWLDDQAVRLRPRTLLRYRQLLTVHALPVLGRRPLCEIRPVHIQAVLRRVLEQGRTPATAQRVRTLLHKVLGDARRLELIAQNPVDPVPSPPQRRAFPTLWDLETLRRFLRATEGTRWWPLWVVLAVSGMRLGECLALTWDAVDLATGEVWVRRSLSWTKGGPVFLPPKTPSGQRRLVLPDLGRQALGAQRRWVAGARLRAGAAWCEQGLVFPTTRGTPLTYSVVREAWLRALAQSGAPRCRLHDLRHLAATVLVGSGLDLKAVAAFLGHADGGGVGAPCLRSPHCGC
jgi:integrase